MPIRRASACVVCDVQLTDDVARLADSGWTRGPFPVRQRADGPNDLADRDPADAPRRLTYLEPRVAEALYGLVDAPRRWHRRTRARIGPAEVHAVELLRIQLAGPTAAIAVMHVMLPDDPLGSLAALARMPMQDDPTSGRPALAQLLPPGTVVAAARAQTIAHLTFAGSPTPVMPARYTAWPADRQWLWLAASATPVDDFPPDVEDGSLFAGLVHLSADWRALVLRDGVAFVGLTDDPGGDDVFHAAARTYVHSIYLDAFLLGHMQIAALRALSNRMAEIHTGSVRPRTLFALEAHLMEVRRTLWSRHVTMRGQANELLTRYQAQHRLPELLQDVLVDLTDAARLVEAVTARSVNAGLGLLTVLGLPFGLAYAGGAVLADQSVALFGLCTAVALVMAGVLLAAFPPLRRMLDALRTGRRT